MMRMPIELRRSAGTEAGPGAGETRKVLVVGAEPLSVFRLWLVFAALCLGVLLAALCVLYAVLAAAGVLAGIEHAVNAGGIGHGFHFSLSWILARTALVGAILVVLSAALAACLAALYGRVADIVGGIDVTVWERPELPAAQSEERPSRTPGRRPAA